MPDAFLHERALRITLRHRPSHTTATAAAAPRPARPPQTRPPQTQPPIACRALVVGLPPNSLDLLHLLSRLDHLDGTSVGPIVLLCLRLLNVNPMLFAYASSSWKFASAQVINNTCGPLPSGSALSAPAPRTSLPPWPATYWEILIQLLTPYLDC